VTRWPAGLKIVFAFIAAAGLISLVQAIALATGSLPASALNLAYAGASVLSYGAAVVFGVTGKRRAFFWSGIAIACLQLLFTGRFLLSMVRLVIDLQVSPFPLGRFELWNVTIFVFATSLAVYLLLVERPRLRRASDSISAPTSV
jgi:hypothetical protein